MGSSFKLNLEGVDYGEIDIWSGSVLKTWQSPKLFNNHYENNINNYKDNYHNNGGPYFSRACSVLSASTHELG